MDPPYARVFFVGFAVDQRDRLDRDRLSGFCLTPMVVRHVRAIPGQGIPWVFQRYLPIQRSDKILVQA